jgi:hypothetical protein
VYDSQKIVAVFWNFKANEGMPRELNFKTSRPPNIPGHFHSITANTGPTS